MIHFMLNTYSQKPVKLIALIENKMALIGVKKLDDKVVRFETPMDFIKNISKV